MIILNAIRTPDGTVIKSHYNHHFVTHTDANGHTYSVDGGRDYLRRATSDPDNRSEDISVMHDAPYEVLREAFHWGTLGLGDRKGPIQYVALKDLSTEHILAIMRTQVLPFWMKWLFRCELVYRMDDLTLLERIYWAYREYADDVDRS